MKTTKLPESVNTLTKYGALAMAISGISEANAEIIYTNIIDEGGPLMGADIIFNGVVEFTLGHLSNNVLGAWPLGNSILGSFGGPNSLAYPFALYGGSIINSSGTWQNAGFQEMNYNVGSSCYYGNWCTIEDAYLGLRFDMNGDTHYGWARVEIIDPVAGEWLLKDYAYEDVKDTPIVSGAGSLSLEDNLFSNIKIVSLNKSIGVYNLNKSTDYTLFNISGQTLIKGEIDLESHIIEAKILAAGVYIIELEDRNTKAVIRKKFVL